MIKRRVKPSKKIKIKRRPKLTEWKRLYNRLSDEDSDFGVYAEVAKHQREGDIDGEVLDMIESICAKLDTTITSLQVNYPKHVSWRVHMVWTDYEAKPKHGYLYPRVASVKTSTHLIRAVTLAYLEICHHARRWV